MYYELTYEEMLLIDGGVNGWLIVGGVLICVGGVAEACTGALTVSGVATIIGGAGMIISGCK